MLSYLLRDNKLLGTKKYQSPHYKPTWTEIQSPIHSVLQVPLSIQWRFSESGGKKNTHSKNKQKKIVHIYLESSHINKRTDVFICFVKGGNLRSVIHASNKCSKSVDSTGLWQRRSSSWECLRSWILEAKSSEECFVLRCD